jgi:hypothetical protein
VESNKLLNKEKRPNSVSQIQLKMTEQVFIRQLSHLPESVKVEL